MQYPLNKLKVKYSAKINFSLCCSEIKQGNINVSSFKEHLENKHVSSKDNEKQNKFIACQDTNTEDPNETTKTEN